MADSRDNPRYQQQKLATQRANDISRTAGKVVEQSHQSRHDGLDYSDCSDMPELVKLAGSEREARRAIQDHLERHGVKPTLGRRLKRDLFGR